MLRVSCNCGKINICCALSPFGYDFVSFFLILCLSLFPHLQNLLTNGAIAYNFIACGVRIFSAHHPNTLANFTPCKTSLGIVKIDKLPTSCRGSANEGYCRAVDCMCTFAILVPALSTLWAQVHLLARCKLSTANKLWHDTGRLQENIMRALG